MNIFAVSNCPIECAEYLDDLRANKMCLETAQMLATAVHCEGGKVTYKPTHQNHPATRFVRQTRSNYIWTLRHFAALCRRFRKFRGKAHGCEKYIKEFIEGISLMPEGEFTGLPNCAGNSKLNITYKHIQDTNLAYKWYLHDRWDNDVKPPTRYGLKI